MHGVDLILLLRRPSASHWLWDRRLHDLALTTLKIRAEHRRWFLILASCLWLCQRRRLLWSFGFLLFLLTLLHQSFRRCDYIICIRFCGSSNLLLRQLFRRIHSLSLLRATLDFLGSNRNASSNLARSPFYLIDLIDCLSCSQITFADCSYLLSLLLGFALRYLLRLL